MEQSVAFQLHGATRDVSVATKATSMISYCNMHNKQTKQKKETNTFVWKSSLFLPDVVKLKLRDLRVPKALQKLIKKEN